MQIRSIGLALAVAALIVVQSSSRATAQAGAPTVEELSAAQQQKKQATSRTPAATKPVRSTPAVRSHTTRATPKTTTPKIKSVTPATTRKTKHVGPTTTPKTKHVGQATPKTKHVSPITTPNTKHVGPATTPKIKSATPTTTRHHITPGPGVTTKRHVGPTPATRHITRGPGAINRRIVTVPPRYWNGWRRPARIVVVRDRWRYWGPYGWRTYVPFTALATFAVGAAMFYPAGYVSMPEPACAGITVDGNRLRWTEVPLEEGGSEWQCVAYSPEPNRVIAELALADEPAPLAPGPTVGAAPVAEPAEQARGCEIVIYSEANLGGSSAPTGDDQADLDAEGWKDQIASVQVKSGTWDFFTGDNYTGEMMRLGPGSYQALDPKWTRRIGSFMCSKPAGA